MMTDVKSTESNPTMTQKKPRVVLVKPSQVIAGAAIVFITCLAFCSMMLDQGLFQYYERVLHDAHRKELQNALGFSLTPNTHGGSLRPEKLDTVKKSIEVMFVSLPKNQAGRISVDVMRYMAHRYFSHKYSWIIKGFEPHHSNASLSDAQILRSQLPEYCARVLEGSLASTGFSLDDAATVLGGVEQLIFDEVVATTESAYHINNLQVTRQLSKQQMLDVVYSYLIEGMLESNFSSPEQHQMDKTNILEIYPNWHSAQLFIDDVIGLDAFEKKHSNSPYMRGSQHMYSFEETAKLTTRISQEFGPWANYECKTMKETLSNLDAHGTGRVKISDFWGVKVKKQNDDQWQFQESAAYLRSLGALDESDTALGAQVIIPNYVYAMSNCIMSTPHYSVCCLNDCESTMRLLESDLQAPQASSSEIMKVMEQHFPHNLNPTVATGGDNQDSNGTLHARLQEIAAQHEDGLVPLHGRLFAQWLHYAFPRECPYPHEVGTLNPMTPAEFIEAAGAGKDDPTVVLESDLEKIAEEPQTLLPPSPFAGKKMWVTREKLLASSTASDHWLGLCLRAVAGMLLVTGLLLSILRSIHHLRKVLFAPKTAAGASVTS
eukprot:gnl/MRDRNA2_/MRDRNA2_120746_c0_seq1.p1 gnl/MRDRNA2_/MRDRNA2_120746_c0~~gnl/MRDRNA2_/MRDRNA2_120746_c0_seq1.p1  ORF type:complete len:604 (+),score=112.67 gnl/MRDRNA2_/MRDRNA2_120746_c0_seq1:110-1921(+)